MNLKKVFIFGGTHGNEWTGAFIVKKYSEQFKQKFPELDLEFILANPEAFKENRRFKEEDLNRAFQYLSSSRSSYELTRALEISKMLKKEPCLILDLHTTTSNLGPTLIVTQINDFNLKLCSNVQNEFPECRIILSPDPLNKYLVGQSPFALMIEVGPIANGVIEAQTLETTNKIIEKVLSSLSTDTSAPRQLEVFEEVQDIYYPKDENNQINAYIHSQIQGKDFQKLQGRVPVFVDFHGNNVFLEIKEDLYPIFINEAAYYGQGLAMTLCRKKVIHF